LSTLHILLRVEPLTWPKYLDSITQSYLIEAADTVAGLYYYARVYGVAGASHSYTLTITFYLQRPGGKIRQARAFAASQRDMTRMRPGFEAVYSEGQA
jgi:hypothetical protein